MLKIARLYPYYNYLNMFVKNVAYHQFNCENPLEIYTSKLKIIDSIIESPKVKDHLIYKVGYLYFNKKDTPKNRNSFIKSIENITKNQKLLAKIKVLSGQKAKLSPGTDFPNFEIITQTHKRVYFKDILKQPTVLYFWSQSQPKHLKSVHEKVKNFNKDTYKYVGVSIDDNTIDWNIIQQKFNLKDDYLMVNNKVTLQRLMLKSIHKVFVLNENGIILNDELNLFDVKFEEKLLKL